MIRKLLIVIVAICLSSPLFAAELPQWELDIIRQVAKEYSLTPQEVSLLKAIRKHENGGPGLYFGIHQDDAKSPARRAKHNRTESYRIQCRWAAGTIQKRYNGNLYDLAKRWCPKGPETWYKSVNSLAASFERERYEGMLAERDKDRNRPKG